MFCLKIKIREIKNFDLPTRESDNNEDFMDALKVCKNHRSTQGLITVGRLRCLRNRFQTQNTQNICGRFFRVNAIKNDKGVWTEHPKDKETKGNPVFFHHFPEFDPLHGSEGIFFLKHQFFDVSEFLNLFFLRRYNNLGCFYESTFHPG